MRFIIQGRDLNSVPSLQKIIDDIFVFVPPHRDPQIKRLYKLNVYAFYLILCHVMKSVFNDFHFEYIFATPAMFRSREKDEAIAP